MDNCFDGCSSCDYELCPEETTTEEPTTAPTTTTTTELTTEPTTTTTASIPEGEEILVLGEFIRYPTDIRHNPLILQELPFRGQYSYDVDFKADRKEVSAAGVCSVTYQDKVYVF